MVARNRLPWRLILGLLIPGGFVVVPLTLAPAFLKARQLRNYLHNEAGKPEIVTMSDAAIQTEIAGRAQNMGLPLTAPDVQITRQNKKMKIEARYTVSFELYQAELEFHSSASLV